MIAPRPLSLDHHHHHHHFASRHFVWSRIIVRLADQRTENDNLKHARMDLWSCVKTESRNSRQSRSMKTSYLVWIGDECEKRFFPVHVKRRIPRCLEEENRKKFKFHAPTRGKERIQSRGSTELYRSQ